MWLKFKASIQKEFLLLIRDKAGLAILFIMPMALVLIMTLLQDSSFKAIGEKQLPLLIVNHDADTFGLRIIEGLKSSQFFKVVEEIEGQKLDEKALVKQVEDGNFQIGIVIHPQATHAIRESVKRKIQGQFPDDELFALDPTMTQVPAKVDIFFDPVTKQSFKQVIISALRQYASMVEANIMFSIYAQMFNDLLGVSVSMDEEFGSMVVFDQQYASTLKSNTIPNSAQHNVPAWTIFAMFFIVIPLASNIIKERDSGLERRLRTLPGSYSAILVGKTMVYFIIGLLQAVSMLLMGVFVLPYFDMPSLNIGNAYAPLLLITIAVSLAATSYGILLGTVATSHEQSSIFGAISVVILAAIGGVWVPTFMMNDLMKQVSQLSPLNWGLNGYYDVFLRSAAIEDVFQYLLLLMAFMLSCLVATFAYNRLKRKT